MKNGAQQRRFHGVSRDLRRSRKISRKHVFFFFSKKSRFFSDASPMSPRTRLILFFLLYAIVLDGRQ
jgi:hypothetical protein